MSQNIKTSNGWVKTAGNFDTTEITNSRSGIDGTVYNSLDTRLDTEIGQLSADIVDLQNCYLTNSYTVTSQDKNCENGIYINGVLNTSYSQYKCIKLDINDIAFIKYTNATTSNTSLVEVCKNNEWKALPKKVGEYEINVTDYDTLTFNFFGGNFPSEFVIFKTSQEVIQDIDIRAKSYIDYNLGDTNGYYVNSNLTVLSAFTCKHVDLSTLKYKGLSLSVNVLAQPVISPLYYIENGNFRSITTSVGSKTIDLQNVTDLYMNFFDGTYVDYFRVEIDGFAYKSDIKNGISYGCSFDNSVEKPFNFNGKKAYFFGDSITQGYIDDGQTITQNGYPKLFSEKVGLNYVNKGIGGSTYGVVSGHSVKTIPQTIEETNLSDADFIFISGGTNDLNFDSLTSNEFKNSVKNCFDYLKTTYPNATVIIIAPINKNILNMQNSHSTMIEYRDILAEESILHNFNFVNGGCFNFPIQSGNLASFLFGGTAMLHPSENGYMLYARALETILC